MMLAFGSEPNHSRAYEVLRRHYLAKGCGPGKIEEMLCRRGALAKAYRLLRRRTA